MYMNILRKIEEQNLKEVTQNKKMIDFNVGDSLSASYKTTSGEFRIFRGIVIAKDRLTVDIMHTHSDSKYRMRRKFFIHAPDVTLAIDRKCRKRPKRAKLFFLINAHGKNVKKIINAS